MKKLSFLFGALAAMSLIFSSCQEKAPSIEDVIEDGFYVQGAATALDKVATKGLFAPGLNEAADQVQESGLWEKYIALESGKEFAITQVKGADNITYGLKAAFTDITTDGIDYSINGAIVKRGELVINGTMMTVAESGLYHVVIYMKEGANQIDVIPVKFGTNSIANGAALTPGAFNKESITFTLKDAEVTTSTFKFNSWGGWKHTIKDPEIKVNCNFGLAKNKAGENIDIKFDGSASQLQAGGADIAVKRANKAKYNVELVWTLEAGLGITAKMVKTGNVDLPNPVDYKLELIGAAIGSWDNGIAFSTGVVDAGLYKYTISNQKFLVDGFKVRTAGSWEPINLGFANIKEFTGDKANFIDKDGNISVIAETTYKTVTLIHDADAETWSLDFQK